VEQESKTESDTDWSNDIINNISNDSPLFDMITDSSKKDISAPEINFSEVGTKEPAPTPVESIQEPTPVESIQEPTPVESIQEPTPG
jgi:hypothetical protein